MNNKSDAMSSLFHSFPRNPSSRANEENRQIGLMTLQGLCKLGFVLVPELIKIEDRAHNREMEIGQKRICFTHIPESKLKEHALLFGPFSVEFDLEALNRAGATPVYYYPPSLNPLLDSGDVSGIAVSLILRLGDMAALAGNLANIKKGFDTSGTEGESTFNLKNGKMVSIRSSELYNFLTLLEQTLSPLQSLHDSIRAFSQLFYPSYNPAFVGPHAYYQQHEWRIISEMSYNGINLSRPVIEEEKDFLLKCNHEFFNKQVRILTGTARRVDECRIYIPPKLNNGMKLAKRIIAPKEWIQDVKNVIQAEGFGALEVAPLEGFV